MRSDAPENEASAGTDARPEPPTPFTYRGNGKVARLPKALRDKIGNWLVDGVSYPEIIEKLGEDGKDLKPDNLCEWKKRGHKQWLMEQTWLAQLRARQESASAMAEDFDATNLNHAALQLATLQIFEALRGLASPQPSPSGSVATDDSALCTPNSSLLDTLLGGDSSAFARLLNALARASRETTQLQKYREDCAKARAALKPMLDPNRKLTESENRAIARKVSTLFGLDRELKPEEITFTYGHRLPGKEVEMFGVSKPLEGSNAPTSSPAQKAPSSPSTSNNNL